MSMGPSAKRTAPENDGIIIPNFARVCKCAHTRMCALAHTRESCEWKGGLLPDHDLGAEGDVGEELLDIVVGHADAAGA